MTTTVDRHDPRNSRIISAVSAAAIAPSRKQLYDYGIYRLRQQLAPIPGITLPTPAGGKYRQIMVDLDPSKLLAKG
jgi:multidrug efflux pump subunit AcrB